jgi:ribonucleoside-diphosphate reductase alpha chain
MFIEQNIRFKLRDEKEKEIRLTKYEFGFPESGFGEVVYLRTYSRKKEDGSRESWHDTVIRVINGIFTIRKWWYKKHKLLWNEEQMQDFAFHMAISMLNMRWLPAGRGLFAMGTNFIYERGSFALYNCAYTEVEDLAEDCSWFMESLMYGTGVGFGTKYSPNEIIKLKWPKAVEENEIEIFVIEDSREGWVDSVRRLLQCYTIGKPKVKFDYSNIRAQGEELKSFGGTASGPEPLRQLHKEIIEYCEKYLKTFGDGRFSNIVATSDSCHYYGWTRLVADICNSIGIAVIAGSSRRSAEICLGDINDFTFLNLKNFNIFPERQPIAWMSNNSVRLETKQDFLQMQKLADYIIENGEPGIINIQNLKKYARMWEECPDPATGINPCGEIPLESKEVCNISEVFPMKSNSKEEFFDALTYATFYCSTVYLLPTHDEQTNKIIAKNHRMGVSLSGIAQWTETWGMAQCIRWMRDGYKHVKEQNKIYNTDAGIPPSIRLTTVKPGGTVPQLVGASSGIHFPPFRYAIRRIIINKNNSLAKKLINAQYPYEPMLEMIAQTKSNNRKIFDKYLSFAKNGMVPVESEISYVFEFPIHFKKARAASGVSAWEQFSMLATLQREWSDNSVSCTIYFDKSEISQIPYMLAQFAPVIKSVSMLPHTEKGAYAQIPYEGISKEEYEQKISHIQPVDWQTIDAQEDPLASSYCESDRCTLPNS